MSVKIALAGNPNCGKTTLFNALTGANQFVGNWPGVTVEKKEGRLKGNREVIITDLPGIYSLSPYTLEEVVARNYLISERPDAILNIVDGTNLERNLYLTTQLTELGIPVVMAVNMMDIVAKNGDKINIKELSEQFGCEAVEISALKGKGVKEAADKAVWAAARHAKAPVHTFGEEVESALSEIQSYLGGDIPEAQKRFYAIKLFERDEKIKALMKEAPDVEEIISKTENAMDDDSESIITNERYEFIGSIIKKCCTKKHDTGKMTISDKIDRVVTNRWAALPIFAAVMFIVYYVSITTVGTMGTDWTNDCLFGDGFHLLAIGDSAYEEAADSYAVDSAKTEAYLDAAKEAGIDTDSVRAFMETAHSEDASQEDTAAYETALAAFEADAKAAGVIAEAQIEDEDGRVIETYEVSAADFAVSVQAVEPDPADYGIWVPGIPVLAEQGLTAVGCADWLKDLIVNGIIAGVGAVLGFVPQMLVLFIFLAALEACGYMARVAFIMDRIFRKFGLSGKSFIPMLIGTGCGIPGVMASRTIENERDRRMTIMTTTFIPCGAKLPIIALIAGAFFGNAGWVAVSAYFTGVAAIIVSGIILKKTKMFAGDPAPFVMELPAYHIPTAGNVVRSVWERGSSFIKKAGTIILLSTIVLWFLQSYGFTDGGFGAVGEDLDHSLLGYIGRGIYWIFIPLGWGHWEAAVAAITGLIAKENVVATYGILYGFAEVAEDGQEIWGTLAASFSAAAAYGFLIFNLLCAPCFAAIGAIKREMNNAKWTWFAIGYQTIFAYAAALCIYQIGTLVTGGGMTVWTVAAFAVIAVFIYLLFRPSKDSTAVKAGKKVFAK